MANTRGRKSPTQRTTTTEKVEKEVVETPTQEAVQNVSNAVSALSKIRAKRNISKKQQELSSGTTVTFALTGNMTPPGYHLKPQDHIYIPPVEQIKESGAWDYYEPLLEKDKDGEYITGQVTIRYAKGQNSIFEQNQPKEVNLETIHFKDGRMDIQKGRDGNKYRFCMLTNLNLSKPLRDNNVNAKFMLHDTMKQAKEESERLNKQVRVNEWMKNSTDDEKFALAVVAGVDTADMELAEVIISNKAYENPDRFLRLMNSEELFVRAYIKSAMDMSVFYSNGQKIHWRDGKLMLVAPDGVDAIDFLVSYVQRDEGRATYEEILSRLN